MSLTVFYSQIYGSVSAAAPPAQVRTEHAQLEPTGSAVAAAAGVKGRISDSRNINDPVPLISAPDPLAARPVSRTSTQRVSVGQPVLRDHTQ